MRFNFAVEVRDISGQLEVGDVCEGVSRSVFEPRRLGFCILKHQLERRVVIHPRRQEQQVHRRQGIPCPRIHRNPALQAIVAHGCGQVEIWRFLDVPCAQLFKMPNLQRRNSKSNSTRIDRLVPWCHLASRQEQERAHAVETVSYQILVCKLVKLVCTPHNQTCGHDAHANTSHARYVLRE